MSPIKAVLFDLDDTLWPIVPVIKRAENLMFAWLTENVPEVARRVSIDGMRTRRQELMATDPVYQLDLRVLRRAVLSEAFVEAGADPALIDGAMAVFSQARNQVTPFADVQPALLNLQARFALGSISNGVADLQAIGIAHFFRISVAAHRIGCAKPDAAIFLAACEGLGVEPEEAVYVGDDPLLDVEGAQKAGLRGVWITRPELEPVRRLPPGVQPDATFAGLHELERWLTGRTVKL